MWVFNEYELIKLATLNYNLIPSLVPLQFLAQDHILPTFCSNLLGRNVPTIKTASVFHPVFFVSMMSKEASLGNTFLSNRLSSCNVCISHTHITSPSNLLASICFPVSGVGQYQYLSGADSELCHKQRRPCLKKEKALLSKASSLGFCLFFANSHLCDLGSHCLHRPEFLHL